MDMAAHKKKATNKDAVDATAAQKHWFPADAEPSKPAAVKKSPWQRRAAPINFGTLAAPGISLRAEFDKYIEEKHTQLSDAQRIELWKVVGSQMLEHPRHQLHSTIEHCLLEI
jgi:hypothetical protein